MNAAPIQIIQNIENNQGNINIEYLWDLLKSYGYEVRKAGESGLEAWQKMKTLLSEYKQEFEIKDEIKDLIENFYVIGSDTKDHLDSGFNIDNIKLNNRIEIHHFFIQHFRIPSLEKNKLSVLKLAQIAYNCGQFLASCEKSSYDEKVIDFYNFHKLSKVETFIQIN